MIPSPTVGNFLKGLLMYNDKKVDINDAKLLFTNNVNGSIKTFQQQYMSLIAQRKTKNNLLHISLNWHENDRQKLEDEDFLKSLVQEFITHIEIPADHPYLVYQHFDKTHPHVHIAIPLIKDNGKMISTHHQVSNYARVCHFLERKYNLTLVERGKRGINIQHQTSTQTKDHATAQQAIEYSIRHALARKPCNLHEFENELRKQSVVYNGRPVQISFELSKKFNGITYFVQEFQFDKDTYQQATKGVKGSLLPNGSHPKLILEFTKNQHKKQIRKYAVQKTIEECLETSATFEAFNASLLEKNVKSNYFTNASGLTYGVEFIDGKTGIVYKGAELKQSITTLKKKLNQPPTPPLVIPPLIHTSLSNLDALELFSMAIDGINISAIHLQKNTTTNATIDTNKITESFQKNPLKIYNAIVKTLLPTTAPRDEKPTLEQFRSILANIQQHQQANPVATPQYAPAQPSAITVNEPNAQLNKPVVPPKKPFMKIAELKQTIDLVDLAESLGFVITKDSKRGSKFVKMKYADSDPILISKLNDSPVYNHYYNPLNKLDRGDIINFLENKKFATDRGEAVKILNDKTTAPKVPLPTKTTTAKTDPTPKTFRPIHGTKTATENDYLVQYQGIALELVKQYFPEYIKTIDHQTLSQELTRLYGPKGRDYFLQKENQDENGQKSRQEYIPAYDYNIFPIFDLKNIDEKRVVGQEVANENFKHLVQASNKDHGAWYIKNPRNKKIAVCESPSKALAYLTLTKDTNCSPFATMGNPSNAVVNYLANLNISGTTIILGGDNDAKGQYFNFRIAAKIASNIANVDITPSITYPPSGDKSFTLTLTAAEQQSFNHNNNKFSALASRTGALLINDPSYQNRTALKFALSGNEDADSQRIAYILAAFTETYGIRATVERPKLKDFNEDLKAKQRNTPTLRITNTQ